MTHGTYTQYQLEAGYLTEEEGMQLVSIEGIS